MEEKEIGFSDILFYLYKFRWYLVIFIIGVVGIVTILSLLTPQKYKAKMSIIVEDKSWTPMDIWDITNSSARNVLLNNYRYMIFSRALLSSVWEEVKDKNLDGLENIKDENGWRFIGDHLGVNILPNTDIIEISFVSISPKTAAVIANAVGEKLYKMQQEMSRIELKGMIKFLEDQLNKVEGQLKSQEESVRIFEETVGVMDIDNEYKVFLQEYVKFKGERETAVVMREYYRGRIKELSKQLGIDGKSSLLDSVMWSMPALSNLQERLSQKESEKMEFLSKGYKETHPGIVQIDKEILSLKKQIKEFIEKYSKDKISISSPSLINDELYKNLINDMTEIVSLDSKIKSLDDIINRMEKKQRQFPYWAVEFARRKREKMITEEIYLMLKKKYEEVKISEAGKMGNIKILDKAYPPTYPISPRKKMNVIIAFLISLFLSAMFIIIYAAVDDSLYSVDMVEKITGLPVLSMIPFMKMKNGKDKDTSDFIRSRLITHISPSSIVAESYRSLRTQLMFLGNDLKTILITSSRAGEGKTTTVTNLAITLAQAEKKVIMVDADMRRPVLYKVFHSGEENNGLAQYLVDGLSPEEIIYETEIDNLYMIPHGLVPPNPSEILGKEKMKDLINYLSEHYDYILIDSPPVIAVTDPIVVSRISDVVLLVVSATNSSRRALRLAMKQLSSSSAPVKGVVFNGIILEGAYSRYYKYPYDYYYNKEK